MADLLEQRGARFNETRTHRYRLWRVWDSSKPMLIVVGMNPSIADENDNDPTVERCLRRATKMGYGGLLMLNIMSVIETDSKKLDQLTKPERCDSQNTRELLNGLSMAALNKADILCAWGKPGQKYGSVAWFATQAARLGVTLFCLKTNGDGSPVHPLYQPYEKEFIWFAGVDAHKAAKPLPHGLGGG